VISEVLSPSTAAEDFDFKLPDYRLVPTVNEIAFVSAREKRADIWRREDAGWHVDDLRNTGEISFPSIGARFPMEEVYAFPDQRG
jgi:Uma2 family endonuclease